MREFLNLKSKKKNCIIDEIEHTFLKQANIELDFFPVGMSLNIVTFTRYTTAKNSPMVQCTRIYNGQIG